MERKLKYRKKKSRLLEVNFLDWETFLLMMHLDQPIVPIHQSLELITNSKLPDYLCKKNLSFWEDFYRAQENLSWSFLEDPKLLIKLS